MVKEAKEWYIGTMNDAPEFMHKKYIKRGYRINFNNTQLVKSLFMLHNETVNVWTHLIGMFIFIVIIG